MHRVSQVANGFNARRTCISVLMS